MSHRWRTCASAILLVAAVLSSDAAAQQAKRVVVDRIYTYFIGPPSSLSEMILAADAVVHGRMTGAKPSDTVFPTGGVRVRTAYRFTVNEMLHSLGGHPISPDEIVVVREGGDRDNGPHIARTVQEGFPAFEVGDEYVLFLRWHAGDEAWTPAWGPDGVFELAHGRVDSPGSAKAVAAQRGKPAVLFLEAVRRFGK